MLVERFGEVSTRRCHGGLGEKVVGDDVLVVKALAPAGE